MECSTPGFPVHHQFPEFTQTHVHWVNMPFNHLILCHPRLLPLSIFPSIRVLSNEFFAWGGQSSGVLASTSVLPTNIQDWFPLGWTGWISAVQGTLKSHLQHHSSKASILWWSAFFTIQLSHPYMTTGKGIALTRQTFVGKTNVSAF